jgi:hypothetical protein
MVQQQFYSYTKKQNYWIKVQKQLINEKNLPGPLLSRKPDKKTVAEFILFSEKSIFKYLLAYSIFRHGHQRLSLRTAFSR